MNSSFDMDEWVRSVDFGSHSPLDAYDFIMSDQLAPGSLFKDYIMTGESRQHGI